MRNIKIAKNILHRLYKSDEKDHPNVNMLSFLHFFNECECCLLSPSVVIAGSKRLCNGLRL